MKKLASAGRNCFVAGLIAYFIFLPISRLVPSITSITNAFSTVIIVGLWLMLYASVATEQFIRTLGILALLPILPIATLATGGFIGYGVSWVIAVVAFYFVISRFRILFYLASPIVVFLGLSFFVVYFAERNSIRESVWEEQAGYTDRLDRIASVFRNFELLNLDDDLHRDALDARLNQNSFVGLAVMRHRSGNSELQFGGTVPFWALIPRAVWPEKPEVGGGRSVVADFTGLDLSEGTSFGAGQVLEFYVNFGTTGVIVGFFGLGCLLMQLDRKIMAGIVEGDLGKILSAGMPGLYMLQPTGNLLEILVGVVAAVVCATLLKFILRHYSTYTLKTRNEFPLLPKH